MGIYKIFKDGTEENRIVADEDFVQAHYSQNGYSYELEEELREPEPEPEPEPAPTQLDRVEAQATYTAMMTDTLLPEEV